ncbi:MAG TPA: 50S ribosomal protein L11 methyltransferase [Gaiellaceae bacterium]|nr:50S ribosomal protein L11 methyltransferase [Gaiellaceae bacterium]
MSITVPPARSEQARAVMIELFPEGFEELDHDGSLELAAYTNAAGEERIWQAFGGAAGTDVDGGWEERWRQFHNPVRVGRLWIGPPWETPDADALAVVIDPGRAFGTGGHPTTQLCLELLEAEERASLLDVGCGSGVLSIAAAKLGFAPVLAFDFDPQAVEATERNALENEVEIDVRLADLRDGALPETELAVANIAAAAVVALAPSLTAARVITSGYLVSDDPELPGYRLERRVGNGGWAADLHLRR